MVDQYLSNLHRWKCKVSFHLGNIIKYLSVCMKESAYPLAKRSQKYLMYIRHQSDAGPVYQEFKLEVDIIYLLEILHTTKLISQQCRCVT